MALLEIKTWPETVLSQVAKKVDRFTPELKILAGNMLETMYSAPGVGLAAPQVGRSIRLLVIDCRLETMTDLEKAVEFPLKIFNPEIKKKEGKVTFEEGCLSVPGFVEN